MPRKVIDYTGQQVGKLLVLGSVPPDQKKYKSNTKEWYCKCECGTELQLETRMISGNGKYTQLSCGCIRVKTHLVVTSKIENLTLEFIEKFENFTKYQFLHKAFVKTVRQNYNWELYKSFMEFFYYDKQFNYIYDNWDKKNIGQTYYDLYKPSIDHKIPLSRGGTNELSNLHFITLFENLAKRDMTIEEWEEFKIKTNTSSTLFIESEGRTSYELF